MSASSSIIIQPSALQKRYHRTSMRQPQTDSMPARVLHNIPPFFSHVYHHSSPFIFIFICISLLESTQHDLFCIPNTSYSISSTHPIVHHIQVPTLKSCTCSTTKHNRTTKPQRSCIPAKSVDGVHGLQDIANLFASRVTGYLNTHDACLRDDLLSSMSSSISSADIASFSISASPATSFSLA